MRPQDKSLPFRFEGIFDRDGVLEPRKQPLPWVNILLFAATLLTTTYAGALQRGVNLLDDLSRFDLGLPFALTLMSILLVHEFGHYTLARIHGVNATLPYFIPAPSFVGTFGAFIRMKSPPLNRTHLFDVGVAGPLAGFVVAVAAVYVGLRLSVTTSEGGMEGGIALGSSLLLSFLSVLALGDLPSNLSITLHPIGFAGWIGLLVTAMNLLPAGQLDGGHVVYALFGWRHRWISRFSILLIFALGLVGWEGWLFWGLLLSLMGTRHPPPLDPDTPLDYGRSWLAWMTLGILILTFVPVPFKFPGSPLTWMG
jgi:membrane-associated protease RseP (regulator of RpoE activity)